jgi:hypothetical protein
MERANFAGLFVPAELRCILHYPSQMLVGLSEHLACLLVSTPLKEG